MSIIIAAFAQSPDRGRGLSRDVQVRWALEEVGQPYDVRLVTFEQLKQPPHLAVQPFGQIPTYEEGGFKLFESGAIVLYIAEHHAGLLPQGAEARARVISWMFAACDTMKGPIIDREQAILFERDKPWHTQRLPVLDERVRVRLTQLSNRLGDADWLEGAFTAADIMMIGLLRRPAVRTLLDDYPSLKAYVARGEARPAFQRAFDAQLAVFTASQSAG